MKNLLLPKIRAKLIEKAFVGQKNAYAPYSRYYVGSAVLTKKGNIYLGCNVENASYGLTVCAERTAIFSAVAAGDSGIEAIAIVNRDGGTSCGACRQVLQEFNPNMVVIAINERGEVQSETTLEELLPRAFGASSLK